MLFDSDTQGKWILVLHMIKMQKNCHVLALYMKLGTNDLKSEPHEDHVRWQSSKRRCQSGKVLLIAKRLTLYW